MRNQYSFFILAFLIYSTSALAEEDEQVSKEFDPVFVTANKIPTPMSQLGASVDIITEEQIKTSGAKDVQELLRNVAGFTVVQSGSRGGTTSLFVRGGEANFNLVMIDGIQVNDIGGNFDFSRLTTDNIERIEIVKGSHSAIYGSDAVTSVINIITKRGKGKPELGVSAALGAHKENDGSLIQEYQTSFGGGSEKYGYSVAYGRIDDNGILKINNEYTNDTFSGSLNFSPLDVLNFTITSRYTGSRLGVPTESAGDRFDPLDPDQFDKTKELTLGANVTYTPTSWWDHVLLLGLHRKDSLFKDNPNPDVTFFDSDLVSRTDTDENRYTAEYRTNVYYDAGEQAKFVSTVGIEYEGEEADQQSSSSFGSSEFDESRDNLGFYFQQQAELYDRLYITAGVRVDDNDNFGTEISPRGSIAFLIRETGTKLRGGVGRGIKEPTITDNFGLAAFAIIGNPDLKPEESLSWEAGVDQKLFEDMLELSSTFFWNKYDNLIAFSGSGFPNGTSFENIQESEARGIEFGATLRPMEGLTISGNYTLLDTEVTDDGGLGSPGGEFFNGEELVRRPKHSARLGAKYFYRGFDVNVNGTYVGKRQDLDFRMFPSSRVTLDDYFKVDLAAAYEFEKGISYVKHPKFFIRVENLLNEDYEEVFGFSTERFNFVAGVSFGI